MFSLKSQCIRNPTVILPTFIYSNSSGFLGRALVSILGGVFLDCPTPIRISLGAVPFLARIAAESVFFVVLGDIQCLRQGVMLRQKTKSRAG